MKRSRSFNATQSEKSGKDINLFRVNYRLDMIAPEESLLRKILIRNLPRIEFASTFGSWRRGTHDSFSDIDIFIVSEDEPDKPAIAKSLMRLGLTITRRIDATILTSKDFEERIGNLDYLTATILNDSKFIFGNENFFLQGKRRIFAGIPDTESVGFNRRMGLRMLRFATDRLGNLPFDASRSQDLALSDIDLFLRCLRDCHVGLGYLGASAKMRQLNRAITLGQLLASREDSLVRDVILTEKRIKRQGTFNLGDVKDIYDRSKSLPNDPSSL